MRKNKKLGCLSLLLLSPVTMAMQPLDDQSLSATTGQDGLSVGVHISKIDFDHVAIIDTDGFGTSTNRAALTIAKRLGTSDVTGVDIVKTFNTDGSIAYNSTPLITAVIDTDAGSVANGGAFANVALTFGNDVNGIRIRPFSAYMTPANAVSTLSGSTYTQKKLFSSGTTYTDPNTRELLRSNSNIDIKFMPTNKPSMNLQMGASPQGHLMVFKGAIDSICAATIAQPNGCSFNLVSGTTGAKFDVQLTSFDANGISLDGFYVGVVNDVTNGGLVFGKEGVSDKFNLAINNLQLGDANAVNTNVFNGLKNGSMGNIGLVGASATNLKMTVRGM